MHSMSIGRHGAACASATEAFAPEERHCIVVWFVVGVVMGEGFGMVDGCVG